MTSIESAGTAARVRSNMQPKLERTSYIIAHTLPAIRSDVNVSTLSQPFSIVTQLL